MKNEYRIRWTRIDIGRKEAIRYSDCLNYQIVVHTNYFYISQGYKYIALYRAFKSIQYHMSRNLKDAELWCKNHKAEQIKFVNEWNKFII